ncbi:MAG: PEP/pyruvate-binding domain-containing protein, partial [Actinomycetes bacterium]
MQKRLVNRFSDGSASMRDLLGGKGANLAEMVGLLGPERVPDGFTVTTEACLDYLERGSISKDLIDEIDAAIDRLEQGADRRLGQPAGPLLVSVRSGGRVSMPGMMDTVLNLGLGEQSVEGLARSSGDPRFAWDSYRRLVQMFASVVRAVPGERLEHEIEFVKHASGAVLDTDLTVESLRDLVGRFSRLIETASGRPFPEDPREQLFEAIAAVFASWNGRRAIDYRRIHRIPDEWGTAVNVQAMVFGNLGEDSGSGVAFSRDELTGGPEPSGDWLANAQGEDVVSGSRNALPLSDLAKAMPGVHAELKGILSGLEQHFRDIQDVEFTIERGRLWILQARTAKRPAQASVRFAC